MEKADSLFSETERTEKETEVNVILYSLLKSKLCSCEKRNYVLKSD